MTFENMRLDRITSIVYFKPGAILSWHAKNRADHIIGIKISGLDRHDLGYKFMDLEPDYIYFFNQKDDFFAKVQEVGYCYSIHFTTSEPITTDSFCKKVSNTAEIVSMIQQVEQARLNGAGNELALFAEFYRVCSKFKELMDTPYSKRDFRIAQAKEFIDLHFKEIDCVDFAVNLAGISRRRFGDLFKQQYGAAPGEYVLHKKIRYSQELLRLSNLSVAEVADLSGFCDVYYFSRMFKKITGITPGEFKKQKSKIPPDVSALLSEK